MDDMKTKAGIAIVFFAVFFPISTMRAHVIPYMAITTDLIAEGSAVHFRTSFGAATDIQGSLEGDRAVSYEEKLARIKDYYDNFFSILYGETPEQARACTIAEVSDFAVDETAEETAIAGTYECAEPITNLSYMFVVTDAFSDVFVRFDHYVTYAVGGHRADYIFNQWTLTNFPLKEEIVRELFPDPPPDTFVLANFERPELGQPQQALPYVLKRFLRMGIEHILSGADHILFLLSTILLLTAFRRMLLVATAFTVAHSTTLILAGLGYITLTSKLVEPLIAASIICMAGWNFVLLKKKQEASRLHGRWATSFGFGLVHGLGFAGALADVSVPSRFFVPALLTFNVGVEIGQIALLALVVPLLKFIAWKLPAYRSRILFVCTLLISLVGAYWFITRIL